MTIRELAEKLNVSPATISLVLNSKPGVSEETRQRVQAGIQKYGYVVKRKANNEDHKNVLIIKYRKSGVLLEQNEGFVSSIIASIENELQRRQFKMSSKIVWGDYNQLYEVADPKEYSGVLVMGTEITQDGFEALKKIELPLVVVDNEIVNTSLASVCMNNQENVWLALNYLKQMGHNKIGYLKSSIKTENFLERARSFYYYAHEMGFDFDQSQHEFLLKPTLVTAYEDTLRYLERVTKLPNCFFADNDLIALGAIKAFQSYNYGVPDDVSIIGFDDIPYSAISSPALTTVHVQRDIIGQHAVVQLINLMENPEHKSIKHLVTGALIERESVRRIPL